MILAIPALSFMALASAPAPVRFRVSRLKQSGRRVGSRSCGFQKIKLSAALNTSSC